MSLQIVAVANGYPKHSYLQLGWEAFLASSRKHGIEPVVLGWAQPWRGLGSKPKLLKKAIEEGVVSADHIIFADAYDVWFSESPEVILERYLDEFYANYRIVWNAEKNCFPTAEWAADHPKSETPFRYFNSGLSVGDTQAYHTIFSQMNVDSWPDDFQQQDGKWVHVSDQDFIMAKFLFGQCGEDEPKMALDTDCKLFQTLVGVESMDEIANSKAIGWHANGPAKTAGLMEPLLKLHGL